MYITQEQKNRFINNRDSYYLSAHSGNRAENRQKCRECLAVYRSYLNAFSILGIMEKYETYKKR